MPSGCTCPSSGTDSRRVPSNESYLYQLDLAQAKEAYLTFWFNPNGVVIPDEGTAWLPGKSICLASIQAAANLAGPGTTVHIQPGIYCETVWPVMDGSAADGFVLENSEIAYIDSQAIRLSDGWENNAAPDSYTHSGVINTTIRDNELHPLGFRTDGDNAVGAVFQFANRLRFEGNHVHDVAHNGVQFKSVIQSDRTVGFAPEEIKTGDIVIKDNVFERACQLGTDCSALKIWGDPPDTHIFRSRFVIRLEPGNRAIDPGGSAQYALRLYPPDLPFAVALAAHRPWPELVLGLEPAAIVESTAGTLIVTSTHAGSLDRRQALQPGQARFRGTCVAAVSVRAG